MNAFIRTVTALSRFFAGLAAAMVATSLVLVCQMAVMEYVMGVPAPWPSEIVSYLMMGVVFLGTPYVFATGGHVAIGAFARRAGTAAGRIRGAVVAIISLGFAAAFATMGSVLMTASVSEDWRADDAAWMALWIPYLSFPLGAALLVLQCLAELAAIATGRKTDPGDAADAASFPD